MKLLQWAGAGVRLLCDKRGNVLMIMGFAMIPLTFSTGMVIDYSRAARTQNKLNALSDAAALASVATPMMQKPYQAACNAARAAFRNQVEAMTGVQFVNSDLDITFVENYQTGGDVSITCANGTMAAVPGTPAPQRRRVKVVYVAKSPNMFGGVLGLSTIAIGGTAETGAKFAPNIDFYMLLDVSSSMALPITSAGIAAMKVKTGGCAFACHQSNPNNSDGIKQYKNGQLIDFYTAAHDAGIVLRVDNGKTAIQDTIDTAISTMASNSAQYRFSISTFGRASDFKTVATISNPLATARTAAGNAETIIVEKGSSNWDRQTEHNDSIVKGGQLMPQASGTGTNQAGDTPQSIMFLVTDGMRDEERSGRQMGAVLQDQCTAIKSRPNTRLAVLYTTYDPASIAGDGWSQDNVAWRLPSVGPALKACASPDLFFEVNTDESISEAMRVLFDRATATARLTK